jgi:glycosyltransferase involved in cell wall biosynthesis
MTVSGRTAVDVLVVSIATTPGLRRADEQLLGDLDREGLAVAVARGRYDRLDRWPRQPLLDLYQAAAARRSIEGALRRWRPRSIIHPSVGTAILEPAGRLRRSVVRFDSPLCLNRPGRRNVVQRTLERRVLRLAAVLAPWSPRPTSQLLGPAPPDARVIPLGFPIALPDNVPERREPIVICYAASPRKKGLDIIAEAWQRADRAGRRLLVAGLDEAAGRGFLAAQGVAEPPDLEWCGWLPPERFEALCRRADVFVGASRRDEYGTAQLQALAGGCLLVHTRVPGHCEPVALAAELDPALVAPPAAPDALARCVERAMRRSPVERAAYVSRSRELLRDYTPEAFAATFRDRLVPALREMR